MVAPFLRAAKQEVEGNKAEQTISIQPTFAFTG